VGGLAWAPIGHLDARSCDDEVRSVPLVRVTFTRLLVDRHASKLFIQTASDSTGRLLEPASKVAKRRFSDPIPARSLTVLCASGHPKSASASACRPYPAPWQINRPAVCKLVLHRHPLGFERSMLSTRPKGFESRIVEGAKAGGGWKLMQPHLEWPAERSTLRNPSIDGTRSRERNDQIPATPLASA
jgi:hypothetical protein